MNKLIEIETLPLIPDAPVYQEDLDRIKAKRSSNGADVNCMVDNLAAAMARRGVLENGQPISLQARHIVIGAKIPWSTLQDFMTGKEDKTRVQMTGESLLNLITFLECSCDWLCFGIGEDTETLVKFKDLNKEQVRSA